MATAALVLPGGGLKCVSQVWWCEELLHALVRNRIDLRVIAGSSGGAINAAKLAEGETDQELLRALEELSSVWLAIDRRGSEVIFPVSGFTFVTHAFSSYLLSGDTLWGLVDGSLLGHKPLDALKITRSGRELDIFVRNEITGGKEIICNHDFSVEQDPSLIMRAVVASASMSPFFPPVLINGVPYSDGQNIMHKKVFQAGCDFIFALYPYKRSCIETPGNDFFSRNFKITSRAFTDLSSLLHEAEQKDIEGAMENARDINALEGLRQKERAHFWTPFGKRGVDNRFKDAPFSFQGKKEPRIVRIYLEDQPPSLKTHHCVKGDLSKIRKPCREHMRDVLKSEGLM